MRSEYYYSRNGAISFHYSQYLRDFSISKIPNMAPNVHNRISHGVGVDGRTTCLGFHTRWKLISPVLTV